jgi:hypothetical protein
VDAALERERRTREVVDVPVGEHAELKDRNQRNFHRARDIG